MSNMNEDIIQNIDNKVNKIPLFVCDIARESIEASGNAGNGQTPASSSSIGSIDMKQRKR